MRFGDPETQAILVRLKTSLLDIFEATRSEGLDEITVQWSDESSACVVLASRGYPGKYEKGATIQGLEHFGKDEHVRVFHAGTSKSIAGEILTAGGRVLGVTSTGESLEEALDHCYEAAQKISWDGMQYRRDIGKFAAMRGQAGNG